MSRMQIGGDAEGYMGESFMDAPTLSVGGGGGKDSGGNGSFIANLLDLIGINREVAKGPKPKKGDKGGSSIPPPPVPQVLTDVHAALADTPNVALSPVNQDAPMSSWGQEWLRSNRPITTFDPGASAAPQSMFGR